VGDFHLHLEAGCTLYGLPFHLLLELPAAQARGFRWIWNLQGLGQLLISARIARGVTQRELAEKLGVHDSQVSCDPRSADGRRIVANGDSIGQLSERVSAACEDLQEVVLERIEIETGDIQLGGAGLL